MKQRELLTEWDRTMEQLKSRNPVRKVILKPTTKRTTASGVVFNYDVGGQDDERRYV